MDPNACYDLLIDALNANDWDEATEHARVLWNWLAEGGFKPSREAITVHYRFDVLQAPGLAHIISGINRKLAK